jgi:GTP 3',8-cyclase
MSAPPSTVFRHIVKNSVECDVNDMEPKDNKDNDLIDNYNRKLSYLRISITDHCNLNCIYCQPYAFAPKAPHDEILRYEEILRIVKVVTRLGISKVRITGGEPLVRQGVYDFLDSLNQMEGLSDISLTTNGVILKDNLQKIQSAGIKRMNISLDSLQRDKIKRITGHDVFPQVWEGILQAHEMGFFPIKLNLVAIKGLNDDEFLDFARLSLTYPFHIRFIEYMPIGEIGIGEKQQIMATEIKDRLQALGTLHPIAAPPGDGGPAERFRFEGAKGEIGFIRPISRHFCKTCNRLRLTAIGQLRVCLLSNRQVDLKTPMRQGCSDDELKNIILEAVRLKPMEHHLHDDNSDCLDDDMSAIGG